MIAPDVAFLRPAKAPVQGENAEPTAASVDREDAGDEAPDFAALLGDVGAAPVDTDPAALMQPALALPDPGGDLVPAAPGIATPVAIGWGDTPAGPADVRAAIVTDPSRSVPPAVDAGVPSAAADADASIPPDAPNPPDVPALTARAASTSEAQASPPPSAAIRPPAVATSMPMPEPASGVSEEEGAAVTLEPGPAPKAAAHPYTMNAPTATEPPVLTPLRTDERLAWTLVREAADPTTATGRGPAASPPPPPPTGQIAVALTGVEQGTVEIRLDPPELGRVQIHLTPTDGGLLATVLADRPETGDLLRRNAEQLARDLADAGFGEVSLEFATGEQAPDERRPEASPAGSFWQTPLAPSERAEAPLRGTGQLDIRL